VPSSLGAVVLVVPDFEPACGGTVRQAGLQARALAASGRPAVVLTRRLDPSWPAHERRDGVEVWRLGGGSGGPVDRRFLVETARWLRRRQRSVAVVQSLGCPDVAVASRLAGMARRTVVVWSALGEASELLRPGRSAGALLRRGVREYCYQPTHHVALNEAMERELRSLGVCEQLWRIPVPVDIATFRPPTPAERRDARRRLGVPEDGFVVAYSGHLRRLKRVDRIIEAFRLAFSRCPSARLVLIGGGAGLPDDVETELRAQACRLSIGARVLFTGRRERVAPLLWAADAFVMASEREGQPNSLVEAMASGLACVAPVSAGASELLVNGGGILLDDGEPAKLAGALLRLARDESLARSYGRRARALVEAQSVERVMASYEAIYAAVLAR